MRQERVKLKHDGLVHVVAAWRVRGVVGIVACFIGFRTHRINGYESPYYEGRPTDDVPTCLECAGRG